MWPVLVGVIVGFALIVPVLSKLLSPKEQDLKGKHVFITGGSQGIGLSLAAKAAGEGAKLTILARNEAKLKGAREEILRAAAAAGYADAAVLAISADVSDEAAMAKAVADASAKHGPINFLFCNAGYSTPGRFVEMGSDVFEAQMKVNYFGAVATIKAAMPSLKEAGRGKSRVVVTCSMVGNVSFYGYSAYGPSKHAVKALCEALYYEFLEYGIGVSVAYPPDTATPGFENENLSKPEECTALAEDNTFTPDQVAAVMLSKAKKGYYRIDVGFDGFMLGIAAAAMTPQPIFWHKIVDIALASVMRLVALVYVGSWRNTVMKIAGKRLGGSK